MRLIGLARQRACGWVCACGEKPGERLACPACGRQYLAGRQGLKTARL